MLNSSFPPSPGEYEHVSIALANSAGHFGSLEHDALTTREATTAWLTERGLVAEGAELQSYCQNRLAGLRGHVQSTLFAHVAGAAVPSRSLDGINAALTAVPYSSLLRFAPESGFFLEVAHPATQMVEHAMSVIAEDLAALLVGPDAPSLARCDAEPCTRVFLRTHGRRQWCSTRCGDRVRAARAYARKREPISSRA